jgi:cell division protein FtsA
MARNTTVGIDIGTYQVKVVVTENIKEGNRILPNVIGSGFAESKGLRHGYIINSTDITKSISQAINQAEESSGIKIKIAFISMGGIGLSAVTSQGAVIITRADSQITDLDIAKVLEVCEKEIPATVAANRKILHSIPLSYKLDGKVVLGKTPLGLKGNKLESKTLFITCLENHLNDLIEAVEETGVEVEDVIASPIAASFVTLSKTQKIAGCVLANIGAETVSIVVFENSIPISLEVFPIGSTDITNDIALGLKIPLEEAESIKLGGVTSTSYPRKKLEEIVTARMSDMFELIEAHLKKISRNGLLPAGIIITGGGSGIGTIEDFAKTFLKIPSKIGSFIIGENIESGVKDSSWSVAYGLCLLGFNSKSESTQSTGSVIKKISRKISSLVKQFMP